MSRRDDRMGYDNNRELLADIKQADEGFDADGRSYIHARLTSRAELDEFLTVGFRLRRK